MDDNYYTDDLISALETGIVMKRYYPLIEHKSELTAILTKAGAVRKSQITDDVINIVRTELGDTVSALFARYIRIYDFNEAKLRDIKGYVGTKDYDALSALLRLPGVRLLRAELYLNSGVTLEVLAERSADEIRTTVSDYIARDNRTETVPLPKEVRCHIATAKMILHTDSRQG